MNKKLTRFFFPLLVILILAVGCAGSQPDLELESTSFSFGSVENGETVNRTVAVYNQGGAALVIQEISTSCSCTTGTIDPMTIQPGESGELRIEFDSGAHGPDLEGEVKRQIFITSNDPDRKEAVVEFTAEITRPASSE